MMYLRSLALLALAAAIPPALAQTLTEQAAATGIAAEQQKRAAPNALGAARKARALAGRKTEDPFEGQPSTLRGLPNPTGIRSLANAASQAAPRQTPPPRPEPQPWQWRLKGTVDNGKASPLALFVSPDGSLVRMRAGTRFDGRSQLLKITRMHIVVEIDGKRADLYPW